MIDFKLIELSDVNEIKKYYDYDIAMGCDTNIFNVYLWRNKFNLRFSIYDDTLIKAYFNKDGSIWGYCMPTGKNIKGALNLIFEDAEERGSLPHIVILTNGQRAMLETLFPSRFDYVRSPENQDYIYLSRDLATLSGKKFHAKRNHISRFYRKYNNTRFETLDKNNKADVWRVFEEWCKENNTDTTLSDETSVIKEALELGDDYGLTGAVLYVDDKPIAMTLGCEISDKVFDICIEKALRVYDGAYAVINNEFAKTLTSYEYINREEDLGIEGLRKAKLSYNPVIILDRFNAIQRCE